MELLFMSFRPILLALLFLFILLSACTQESLLAGSYSRWVSRIGRYGEDHPHRYWGYVDAQGDKARFDKIIAIGIDSKENVYVADAGNHRIRKIDQNGWVSTFVGSDHEQTRFTEQDKPLESQLVGPSGFTMHNDVLYMSVHGCIRSLDLNEQEPTLKTYYGKCLAYGQGEPSDEEFEKLPPSEQYLRDFGTLTHDRHGNLYVVATSMQPELYLSAITEQEEKHYLRQLNKIDLQKRVTPIDNYGSIVETHIVVDNDACVASLFREQTPGPGWGSTLSDIDSTCRKRPENSGFFRGSRQATDPRLAPKHLFALWMGRHDDLYIFGEWLAKLSQDGELSFIAPLQGYKGGIVTMNAAENVIYSANSTAVYRWEIPGRNSL
jgi:hypothetical protein